MAINSMKGTALQATKREFLHMVSFNFIIYNHDIEKQVLSNNNFQLYVCLGNPGGGAPI